MKPTIFTFVFLTLALSSTFALAKPSNSGDKGENQSLNQAIQDVKQQTGGRILSAGTINKNDKHIHKIKVLLPNGKVRIIKINKR